MLEINFKINESVINKQFERWLFDNNVADVDLVLDEEGSQKIVDLFSKSLSTKEYAWLDSLDEAVDKVCKERFENIKKTYMLRFELMKEFDAKSEDEAINEFIDFIKKTPKEELIENANINLG